MKRNKKAAERVKMVRQKKVEPKVLVMPSKGRGKSGKRGRGRGKNERRGQGQGKSGKGAGADMGKSTAEEE